MEQKKLIIWQSWLSKIGGVETFLYNFCEQLRDYYDILVLISGADQEQLLRLNKLVRVEKYNQNEEYVCDICLRNSVWGIIPNKIKAKKYIEMQHTDYVYLKEKNALDSQNIFWDKIQLHVACGAFVGKQYKKATGNDCIVVRNILAKKKQTEHIYKFITCSRLDEAKGWGRMQTMMNMLYEANIKFEWNIFTNSKQPCNYEEVKFWKPRYDIFDYIADADYTVLLSDCEGLPYTVQESLQYDTPCIVTDVGGCTELIQDGVNGYVVPLNMDFDINKIRHVPKISNYQGTTAEDWCNVLGDAVYVEKEKEEIDMVEVKAIRNYFDMQFNATIAVGTKFIVDQARADYLVKRGLVKIERTIEELKPVELKAKPTEIEVPAEIEVAVKDNKVEKAVKHNKYAKK